MNKFTLIIACNGALVGTPVWAQESAPLAQAELEYPIEATARQVAEAQLFIADHALEHREDIRGWPCNEAASNTVAKALKETALALAASQHRHSTSLDRHSTEMCDCGDLDDCPACDACMDELCVGSAPSPSPQTEIDCVDCPDQNGLV
ncbi:MAG: hypothetical protein WA793_02305 [Sphingorhabdus sp.]|uniref:hypothetical protein n=1 Tax=Sphingorhabdus sp. TaxID=1902408 RepID=UPI003C895DE9